MLLRGFEIVGRRNNWVSVEGYFQINELRHIENSFRIFSSRKYKASVCHFSHTLNYSSSGSYRRLSK